DESYKLDVTSDAVHIHAATLFGAYHAFETLLQLAQPQASGFGFPAVRINDSPRFPWRGLLIDSGRHFMPYATVLRTLDGMAAVKLNVLHFHISEDQGFRFESKRFPKLTSMGSEGKFYTQDEIRMIVAYAAARGIRVVPEFDIPGHATSWMVGYPELGSAPGPYTVSHRFGVLDPAMDPTKESTYKFLDEFFGEVVTLFPDQYIHIGGDESNGKQWKANPAIVRFMKDHNLADTHALQAYFNKRVEAILTKHNRKMVGWDEILHPDLPADIVVQNWHGIETLTGAAKQGHLAIYSKPYYLDHMYSAAQMYSKDPIPADSGLTPEQAKRILGGEACSWSEMVTSETVDSRIWPRTAAVAERFWSAQNVTDTDDMYRRLGVESLRLDALGLQHISGPQRLLRQLDGSANPLALTTLAATLSPVEFGVRSHHQHPTTDIPFTNMVDAVVFDPPMQHDLETWVATYLHSGDPLVRHHLEELFQSWIAASASLETLTPQQERLRNMLPRIHELAQLGHIGLDAIKAHETHTALTPDKLKSTNATLTQIAKFDDSLTTFVVLAPLHALVNATK
ncbi:MAG: family 20 glycosylhydrolase, partial [Bryocella sp.]